MSARLARAGEFLSRVRRAGALRLLFELLYRLGRVCERVPIARSGYEWLVAALVGRCGLFDANYYLASNPDIPPRGWVHASLHYIRFGEREGRHPMPLFDPVYYRSQGGPVAGRVNALLHYAWVGRRRGLSPHGWFDPAHYRRQVTDLPLRDALLHFCREGGVRGLSPCDEFDAAFYLSGNRDVAEAGLNPLIHFLQHGRREGRLPRARVRDGRDQLDTQPIRQTPPLPDDSDWAGCSARAECEAAEVDVVVPVYGGRAETLHCLLSVLRSTCDTCFVLVVVDDRGPDPDLAADLERLAARGLFVLLRNPFNQGFVRSANRGMSRRTDRDVVLLNADTEVAGDWLDRLRSAARSRQGVASVTPLSNSATICSYPVTLRDNPCQLELSVAQMDRLAAETNPAMVVEAPSGVGFCMYLTRSAMDAVGMFDVETYGAGYGEENDWCQRAIRGGYVNLVAADVYVWHWGSVSFAGSKSARLVNAMDVLERRFPQYHRDVARFIAADPLAAARARLDHARLLRQAGEGAVLMMWHRRGGGTERQVRAEISALLGQGHSVLELRPAEDAPGRVRITSTTVPLTPNLPSFGLGDETLAGLLLELRIGAIHVHSLIDFSVDAPDAVIALSQRISAQVKLRIHDYESICPRITLTNADGHYCGEPDAAACNRCLRKLGSEFPVVDIASWRTDHGRLVTHAVEVLVPDVDVSSRLARYFGGAALKVQSHEDAAIPDLTGRPQPKPDEPLRIVVIGAINRAKGYDVLRACAVEARKRGRRLEFVLMGYSIDDHSLEAAGVYVTGRYSDAAAPEFLVALRPHAVWLPSVWPETYSFTLSLALYAGLPVFAFDLGAIASRLRMLGRSEFLFPLSDAGNSGKINARFENLRSQCPENESALAPA